MMTPNEQLERTRERQFRIRNGSCGPLYMVLGVMTSFHSSAQPSDMDVEA